MLELFETAVVNRSVPACYRYLLDFSRVREWDPGVVNARRTSSGPIQAGATFSVDCALPIGKINLRYELLSAVTDTELTLTGHSSFFDVLDTITFEALADRNGEPQTCIEYRAAFTFTRFPAALARRFSAGMRTMGRKAVAGLQQALEDNVPVPEQTTCSELADKLVVPGMAGFSKLGYSRRANQFAPMSADITGQHIVITGATSGIGYAMAEELASRGAELSLVMRDSPRAKKAVEDIIAASGNLQVHAELADLSLLGEVDKLVKRLAKAAKPIDVLINNAGALFDKQRNTAEKLDEALALLLLSPVQLTLGLKPLLLKAGAARVLNIVSGGMYTQRLNLPATLLPNPENYSGSVAYARAKRALMIVTEEWAEEWQSQGIVVNAMHPGWADTPGVEQSLPDFYRLSRGILRTPGSRCGYRSMGGSSDRGRTNEWSAVS